MGSGRTFAAILLLFTGETGWLAVTSRFPMAFDEAYHFGLIQFFSHRLNPIVTTQSSSTYKFGALIQGPSLLYHYLLSFPYRFVALFSHSLVTEVIVLRLINVGFAVATLIIMRKLLRFTTLSDGSVNLIVLIFALTPIVTALSAQINYDNLLILMTTLCVYETILFSRKIEENVFDIKNLLVLLCLCLFSSLVQYSFLPIFVAFLAIVIWKCHSYKRRQNIQLRLAAQKSFKHLGKYTKLALLATGILGSLLFIRIYGVNVVKYHNPAPQCNQVLNTADCKRYYAWNSNYKLRQYFKAHPTSRTLNLVQYDAYWLMTVSVSLFCAILPLHGPYYLSPVYYFMMLVFMSGGIVCAGANFKRMMRADSVLPILFVISLVYVLSLWARNYHDYLQLGATIAIGGRYLLPVLACLYVLLVRGVQYAIQSRPRKTQPIITIGLGFLIIVSFIYYGGFMQYVTHITPKYGKLSATNDFGMN